MKNSVDIQNRQRIEARLLAAIETVVLADRPGVVSTAAAARRVYEELKAIAAEQRKADQAARDWATRNLRPGN